MVFVHKTVYQGFEMFLPLVYWKQEMLLDTDWDIGDGENYDKWIKPNN